MTCTRIRQHAYAHTEHDTQAQHRRGAPTVSLGEVPGVSLSGLLGPSLSFYPSNLRPFLFFLFNAVARSHGHSFSRSLSTETLFNYSLYPALNSRLQKPWLDWTHWSYYFASYNVDVPFDFTYLHFKLFIFPFYGRWDFNAICGYSQYVFLIVLFP